MSRFLTLEEVVKARPVNEARMKRQTEKLIARNSMARLIEIRQALKLTQKELAKRIGVDQAHVSRIERGSFLSLEFATLEKYIEALGGEFEVQAKFGEHKLLLVDSTYEDKLKKKPKKKKPRRS